MSPAQLTELADVLHRPKFSFSPADIKLLMDWLRIEAIFVTPGDMPPVLRDPKDDFLLASALAGNARAIVTGDKDVLALGEYKGIPIVTSAEFVSKLR